MRTDTRATAEMATRYVADRRAFHFWDLWKHGSRTYAQTLGIPPDQSWDIFIFYEPQLVWGESPPEPTFWMQARNLDVGHKYSKEGLEEALKPWLEN